MAARDTSAKGRRGAGVAGVSKAGRGRPTKLTPTVERAVCKAVRAGNYIETAAALAGINKDTLYDWLKRGAREATRIDAGHEPDAGEAPYVQFSDAVKKALAESESADLRRIERAGADQWQAAAWRLERRFPDRWGRQRVEVTGKDGGPLEVTLEERAAKRRELVTRMLGKLLGQGISEEEARASLLAMGVDERELQTAGDR
jgi:hypothetical protein